MATHSRSFQKPLFVILLVTLFAAGTMAQRRRGGGGEAGFRFRFIGPVVGNRIAAIAGIAGDPSTYYAGAASGGIWKSVDGGNRWEPIFDDEPIAAIGALAVAPSDKSTVWAGTGEPWAIRDDRSHSTSRIWLPQTKIRPRAAGFLLCLIQVVELRGLSSPAGVIFQYTS